MHNFNNTPSGETRICQRIAASDKQATDAAITTSLHERKLHRQVIAKVISFFIVLCIFAGLWLPDKTAYGGRTTYLRKTLTFTISGCADDSYIKFYCQNDAAGTRGDISGTINTT